jgi:L-methionine (R)-S-oxide reductase
MNDVEWRAWLKEVLDDFGCDVGSLHFTDQTGENLALVAQIGVPEELLERVSYIPFGKGIAGAAAQRREPVEMCNLQIDQSGVARPAAKKTDAAGTLAIPLFGPGGDVFGTLGIGMRHAHDFSDAEKHRLAEVGARMVASRLAG